MEYSIPYNPTEYVQDSVNEVQSTLIEAILLVVLVIVIFLQTWRAAINSDHRHPGVAGRHLCRAARARFRSTRCPLFALVLAVALSSTTRSSSSRR
jgi:multidrug efflux pump subunit AcrB